MLQWNSNARERREVCPQFSEVLCGFFNWQVSVSRQCRFRVSLLLQIRLIYVLIKADNIFVIKTLLFTLYSLIVFLVQWKYMFLCCFRVYCYLFVGREGFSLRSIYKIYPLCEYVVILGILIQNFWLLKYIFQELIRHN